MRAAATKRHPVVVVGAGQAGLSASYCLKDLGVDHVILERTQVGSSWRTQRWDTFCLVTPNWQCQLPGYSYRGDDPQGFMKTSEIIAYLEGYSASFVPPLLEGVEVFSLESENLKGFRLSTSHGVLTADQVIVATGGYHEALIPSAGRALPREIMQIHSADYRNPASLPPGEVLVVGTGQSGCQIAEDLHLAGRRVHLAVGNAPRCARRHRGKDVVEWLHMMGYYDMPIDKHPDKERARDKTNHYVTGRDGGRDIDLRKLALEGMKLYGPFDSVRGGVISFAPGLKKNLDDADEVYRSINRSIDSFIAKSGIDAPAEAEYRPLWEPSGEESTATLDFSSHGVTSIVWCIGFAADFRWIKFPIFDDKGHPQHVRGVTPIEGLYFIGLPWLYTWGSGRFSGVGRDARYIADRVVERSSSLALASSDLVMRNSASIGS